MFHYFFTTIFKKNELYESKLDFLILLTVDILGLCNSDKSIIGILLLQKPKASNSARSYLLINKVKMISKV